jgi:hypothetical protein
VTGSKIDVTSCQGYIYVAKHVSTLKSSWSLIFAMLIPCINILCYMVSYNSLCREKDCNVKEAQGSFKKIVLNWWYSSPNTCNFSFQGWKPPISLQTFILVSAHWMTISHIWCTAMLHATCLKRTNRCSPFQYISVTWREKATWTYMSGIPFCLVFYQQRRPPSPTHLHGRQTSSVMKWFNFQSWWLLWYHFFFGFAIYIGYTHYKGPPQQISKRKFMFVGCWNKSFEWKHFLGALWSLEHK